MSRQPASATNYALLCSALAVALLLLFVAEAAAASQRQRALHYWTPERMESARSLDLLLDPGGEPTLRLGPSQPSAAASYAGVPAPETPPHSFNGRLFIRFGNQRGYCSGTAIDSPTRQLVLTAGHCVNAGAELGGNRWYRDLLFVPAYSGDRMPFGAFPARQGKVFAPPQWRFHDNRDFDLGAFLTYPNKRGERLADAVGGGAAIALDRSRNAQFETFGYPHRSRWMRTCTGGFFGTDRISFPDPGPPTSGVACQWVPGASGGGWLIEGGTEINGLTSYGLVGLLGVTYGPYFSRETVGKLVAGL